MAGKAKTIAERAKEAGVSVATYRNRLKDATADTSLRDRKMLEEIRKLKAEADQAERVQEMLDGDYYPRDVIKQSVAQISHVWNSLLRAAVSELPALLAGLSAAEIEKKIKEWTIDWSDKLSGAEGRVWTNASEAVKRDMRGKARKLAESKARKK